MLWLLSVVVLVASSCANADSVYRLDLNADLNTLHARIDWEDVRKDIERTLLDFDPKHDDGSIAPNVLRLAWHSAALYDPKNAPHGGTAGGATMRFEPEKSYEDNRGLELAREAMDAVQARHEGASNADIWVLASYVAVEQMGGPHIEFKPGRTDATRGGDLCPPEQRFPVWDDGTATLRDKFSRMGLSDRDIVALSGAHTVGHTHEAASGFPYHQWDNTPLIFDHNYFEFLLRDWWVYDDDDKSRPYYRNRSWLMLLSDILLKEDDKFKSIAEEYSKDEALWHKDFAEAFKKVTELGM